MKIILQLNVKIHVEVNIIMMIKKICWDSWEILYKDTYDEYIYIQCGSEQKFILLYITVIVQTQLDTGEFKIYKEKANGKTL